jgi:hypothetical protein
MRTTTALLVLLALALPGVAMPHPCEAEVAQAKQNLDEILKAISTIEALKPGDMRTQMLKGAKGKYDLETRRLAEVQARCDGLVRVESQGAAPAQAAAAASAAPPATAPSAPVPPAAPAVVVATPAPAPAPPPAAPPAAPAAAAAPAALAEPESAWGPVAPDEAFLDRLQGSWRMDGVVGGKAVTYRAQGERVLQRAFLRLHMVDAAERPRYEADVYIAFDPRTKDYVAHWMDRFGASGARAAGAGRRDGDRLALVFPYAGAAFRDTFTWEPQSGTWTLVLESQEAGGEWSTFARYTLVPAPRS